MQEYNIIKTKRLVLREFNKDDTKALFTLLSDNEVNTFLPIFPIKSIDEAEEYLNNIINSKDLIYAICLKSNNIPIGYIKLSHDESHDLGYAVRKEYWNQGITTEAAAALIKYLKTLDLPYITATHDIKNPGSGEVMKKVGMKYKYSYEEQWQPKNIKVIFRMYQFDINNNKGYVYKKYWDIYPVYFIYITFECINLI